MKNRLDMKTALEEMLRLAKQCQEVFEKTSFVFHSYKVEKNDVTREYIDHVMAMARKIVSGFDSKGQEIKFCISSYETIKALVAMLKEMSEKISKNLQNNHKLVAV